MTNSSTVIAFISAVALHLILGGVLLMNVDFSLPKEKPKAVIIDASLVNQKLFDDLAQRQKEKKLAEQKKIDDARKAKLRAEAERKKQEAERLEALRAEQLRKKREIERIEAEKILAAKQLKAKQEAEKAQKIADAQRKKEQQERVKAEELRKQKEAERLQAEKAAKAKAAKEAKIKAAKEAKLKAEQERLRQAALDKQMEAEFADEFSSAQGAKQLSEIARYKALIQDKISRNWQLDDTMKGKTCTLAIRLAPDGLILGINSSRGDAKLCDSAKRAAFKAKTLPIPKDPEIAPQFRDFDITLEPEL